MVTGVIALVRQANPNLTWRDVKLILAESANKTPTSGQVYKVTGKMYSDPAKDQMYENTSGFGIVDAGAAVALAKRWTLLPPMKTFEAETTNEITTTQKDVFHTIPLTVSGSDLSYIESVTIEMKIERSNPDEGFTLYGWNLHLVSPDGKEGIMYHAESSDATKGNFTFLRKEESVMHLLLNSFLGTSHINGEWKLKIEQLRDPIITKIKGWKIIIRGH